MAILKQSKQIISIVIFSIILFSCADPEIRRYNREHKKLIIKNWNLKQDSIYIAVLYQYKKGSEFQLLEKKAIATGIIDNYNSHKYTSLEFDSIPIIATNKDYKLIINNKAIYKIKDIRTSYVVRPQIPLSIDSIYNMIQSFNINNKVYTFKEPRVFSIPKDSYVIKKRLVRNI